MVDQGRGQVWALVLGKSPGTFSSRCISRSVCSAPWSYPACARPPVQERCGLWRCCFDGFPVMLLPWVHPSGLSAAAGRSLTNRERPAAAPCSGLLDVVLGVRGPFLNVSYGVLSFGLEVFRSVCCGGLDVLQGFLGRFFESFGDFFGHLA